MHGGHFPFFAFYQISYEGHFPLYEGHFPLGHFPMEVTFMALRLDASKYVGIKIDTNSNKAVFASLHSALKLEKKCNFKSTKTHFLQFQKWQKINFLYPKKV